MLILAWKSDAQHPLESAYLLQELDMFPKISMEDPSRTGFQVKISIDRRSSLAPSSA